ncbi:MAG: hypothetical protein JWM19_7198 [Actinomycetia bacterium]|nr:hypothetical protein [Actinomycetes bacterium]
MTTYLFVYRAPANYSPSPETAVAWSAWHQSLGASLKDRGNPVFRAETLGAGPAGTVLGGYSLVRAANLDAAAALAKGCPGLGAGMSVEVGEVTNVEDSYDAWLAAHPAS